MFRRRVILVTGKGGVGRSTVASALAIAGGRAGKRMLLTEMEEPAAQTHSPLARHFGRDRFPPDPVPIAEGVRGVSLQTRRGTQMFLESVLPIRAMARLAMRTPALLRLLHAAPSFYELGIFYHLLSLLDATDKEGRAENEVIVFDMPATGHTLALTGLPQILLRLVKKGPIAEALQKGQSYLNDPERGAAYVVTLPETLPVTESLELIEGLRETNMPVGGIIANRVQDDPFDDAERAALADLLDGPPTYGEGGLGRLRRVRAAIERLQREVDVPLHQLPERTEQGRALVDALALAVEEASRP